MERKTEYSGALGAVPPGFMLAQTALAQFHEERVVASEARERVAERAHVTMVVTDALAAGTLVVFVRTRHGDIAPVPLDAWRPYLAEPSRPHTNVERLHKSGLRHDDPLMLAHETFTTTGIALVDLNNWAGFSKYADRWPIYEIPASVRLLLKFCEHKEAMSEGLPLQKADAIEWFRQNWPWEMQDKWPAEDRAGQRYNKKDNCPAFVSLLAQVVLDKKERSGGAIPAELSKAVNDRRKRMAQRRMSDADFEAGLAIIDD